MAEFYGTEVDDSVDGTDSDDFYLGGDGDDTLAGGANDDLLSGDAGDDKLLGEAGDDILIGGAGADLLEGGLGEDIVLLGSAAESERDQIFGGLGVDRLVVDFSLSAAPVSFTAPDAFTSTTLANRMEVTGVEALYAAGGAGDDTLVGGRWDDELFGQRGSDLLRGNGGDDRIDGGQGDDIIDGGAGDDELKGGFGDDAIDGGAGADLIVLGIDEGIDTLDGGAGDGDVLELTVLSGSFEAQESYAETTLDGGSTVTGVERFRVSGSSGVDRLAGASGDDSLDGGLGADTLQGNGGDDLLTALGGGADALDGGWGDDIGVLDRRDGGSDLRYAVVDGVGQLSDGSTLRDIELQVVLGGAGDDDFRAGGSTQVVFDGGLGDDKLTGGSGNDELRDGGGNNVLSAGAGDDFVDVEVYEAGVGGDRSNVNLGAGDDFVAVNARYGGAAGSFRIEGGSGFDTAVINRSASREALNLTLSADATLAGGDVALHNVEAIDITGGFGDDRFTGGAFDDVLDGGSGGRDTLAGGDGDDRLWLEDGDQATGGDGVDLAIVDLSALSVGVSFTMTNGHVDIDATTTLDSIEALFLLGTGDADRVVGGDGADRLDGGSGDDRLDGGAGGDTLIDGFGADRLRGGAGDDVLIRSGDATGAGDVFRGGAGRDTLGFDGETGVIVRFDLADQSLNAGQAAGLTVSQFEIYRGSLLDDELSGAGGRDTFYGGGGGDRLDGRAGNDTLVGGSGADLLTGGTGRDRFVYGTFDGDIGSGDEITDFSHGADKLVITRAGFGLDDYAELDLVSGSRVDPAFNSAGPQFYFDTAHSRLWFDADGTGDDDEAVLVVTLNGVSTLAGSDFAFV